MARKRARFDIRLANEKRTPEEVRAMSLDMLRWIRPIFQADASIAAEEITLESHIYRDLHCNSLDFVELLVTFEEEFRLNLAEGALRGLAWAIGDDDDDERGGTQGESEARSSDRVEAWTTYAEDANANAARALEDVGLSAVRSVRLEQMHALAKRFGVAPFSVGFLCVCLIRGFDV